MLGTQNRLFYLFPINCRDKDYCYSFMDKGMEVLRCHLTIYTSHASWSQDLCAALSAT